MKFTSYKFELLRLIDWNALIDLLLIAKDIYFAIFLIEIFDLWFSVSVSQWIEMFLLMFACFWHIR